MSPGPWELLIVVFIILLLFGGKKFPELARGLGKGLREFKKSVKEHPEPEEDPSKIESVGKKD